MKLPHRRFNPLTGGWVFISPQRTERPWLGELEALGSRGRKRRAASRG